MTDARYCCGKQTTCDQLPDFSCATVPVGKGLHTSRFKEAVLDDVVLSSLLAKFHLCIVEHAPAAECESALLSALARLPTRHTDPQAIVRSVGQERPAVKLAKDFIESHFTEDISISRLARLSSLSGFYFARAFKRVSPRQIGLFDTCAQKAALLYGATVAAVTLDNDRLHSRESS